MRFLHAESARRYGVGHREGIHAMYKTLWSADHASGRESALVGIYYTGAAATPTAGESVTLAIERVW